MREPYKGRKVLPSLNNFAVLGGESVPTGLVWPSPEAEEKLREAEGKRNGFLGFAEGQWIILVIGWLGIIEPPRRQ